MFEALTSEGLLDQITDATRTESAAIAERLGLIGELYRRREQELADTVFWTVDPFTEVSIEVASAQSITRHRAEWQVRDARSLQKLPHVMDTFRSCDIDYRIVKIILNRTANLADSARHIIDEAISRMCRRWLNLSDQKLRDRIDTIIAEHDPDGIRVPPAMDDSRYLDIQSSEPGIAEITGRLRAEAAAALDIRLDTLAKTVCNADPRTHAQRRADAISALPHLHTTMDCLCGLHDCPAATDHTHATGVIVHVFTESTTLDGTTNRPGYMPGFGIQPAKTIRDLVHKPGTTTKQVKLPKDAPEPHYRPSATLADFVRWRDLTCRWPGCDQPATNTDIDHTTPWPYGPTHASNTKLYCRAHHLVKTFCTGWSDRQSPDGTVELTSPTGHIYHCDAHGATLFPNLGTPTGEIPSTDPEPSDGNRNAMMPKRRQTREQDQQHRINTERRQRHELNNQIAEAARQHQQWLNDHAEPPPF